MTIAELTELVNYEGGFTNVDAQGGTVLSLVKECLDVNCAQVRYDDLLLSDNLVTITGNKQSSITLASDIQHLDTKQIRYLPQADTTRQLNLLFQRQYNQNVGLPYSCYRHGTTLVIFPTDQVAIGDTVLYNYWQKPSSLITSEASTIVPDALIPTIKSQIISRIKFILGDKSAGAFAQLASMNHSMHFGAIDLNDANGD